jgi:hypothetical protein
MLGGMDALFRSSFLMAALLATGLGQAGEPEKKAGADTEAEAYADCGGRPIQDGHDVQPTPAHDQCLAQKQKIPLTPFTDDKTAKGKAANPPPPQKAPPPNR